MLQQSILVQWWYKETHKTTLANLRMCPFQTRADSLTAGQQPPCLPVVESKTTIKIITKPTALSASHWVMECSGGQQVELSRLIHPGNPYLPAFQSELAREQSLLLNNSPCAGPCWRGLWAEISLLDMDSDHFSHWNVLWNLKLRFFFQFQALQGNFCLLNT